MTPRPERWPVHRVLAARPIGGVAAPTVMTARHPSRFPSGGLDRAPALPALADLNLHVVKPRRAQAVRQRLRRNRIAGVAEMQDSEYHGRHAVAAGEDAAG